MTAGVDNHRYTLAELEAVATIPPVSTNGGRRRRMGCPFHGSDHQRSLEVDLETGRFSCHNCGAWGYLSDHPGGNRPGRDRREPGRADKASPRPGAYNGFRRPPEARTAPERPTAVLQAPVSPSGQPGQAQKMARHMEAARSHLEAPEALAYLEARHIPMEMAREYGLGYFPPGKWEGKRKRLTARWGRVAFPLEMPAGELVGIYSRALDPAYPQEKAPKEPRHDVWGTRGLFHPAALAGPSLFLTEGPFDALAMLAAGYPTSAALVGTKGLRWGWMSQVQELYLCGDMDAEGMKAVWGLAREAVLHGVRVYIPGPDTYGGYQEPADQWEREGKVTLQVCRECNIAVHPPTVERCPTCGAPMCPGCRRCDPSCPIMV